jgi:hypothetical protein
MRASRRSLKRRERNMDLDTDMFSPLGEDKGEGVGKGGVSECRKLLGM